MTDYQILFGSVRVQRQVFVAGQGISSDLLDERDVRSLLEEGRIAPIADVPVAEAVSQAPVEPRGRWCHDPETLKDLRLAELRTMIREIEPSLDVSSIRTKKVARQLLTQDWRDEYRQPAPVENLDKTEAAPRDIIADAKRKAGGDY